MTDLMKKNKRRNQKSVMSSFTTMSVVIGFILSGAFSAIGESEIITDFGMFEINEINYNQIVAYGENTNAEKPTENLDGNSEIKIEITSVETIREIGKPLDFFGPGPIKIEETKEISIQGISEITASGGGKIGNQIIGQLELKVGMKTGTVIEKTTSKKFIIDLKEDNCIQLYEVLVYQIQNGTYETTDSGKNVTGDWTSRQLTGGGIHVSEIQCLEVP